MFDNSNAAKKPRMVAVRECFADCAARTQTKVVKSSAIAAILRVKMWKPFLVRGVKVFLLKDILMK